MALLNHVADDFVVEVLNVFPLDPLFAIFVLLRFQCQLNEKLLKFLVAVINAKLLKAERYEINVMKFVPMLNYLLVCMTSKP